MKGGTLSSDTDGDIAIDDVTLLDTLCDGTLPVDSTTALTTTPVVTTTTTSETKVTILGCVRKEVVNCWRLSHCTYVLIAGDAVTVHVDCWRRSYCTC